MKRILLLPVIAVALSLSAACAQENPAGPIPGPAPGDAFAHTLEATDQHGESRSLENLYGDKGVAVLFVRSADWCPYCRQQLADANHRLDDFAELGLTVVSVSVDDVDQISAFAEAGNIDYTMLADPDGAINEALGIRDEQYPVGSAAYGVPRPTLYIIDINGIVRARYMEPTYRTRPDLAVVLEDVRGLAL